VIAFMGECQFKTPMPANVCKGVGYVWYIKSKTLPILSDDEVERVYAAIEAGRLAPTFATSREHVRNLRQARSEVKTCPRCGSPMVERTAKSGPRAGSKFLGCSKYPACRAVLQIS
jgi:ribosomal protein L37AE/L43A